MGGGEGRKMGGGGGGEGGEGSEGGGVMRWRLMGGGEEEGGGGGRELEEKERVCVEALLGAVFHHQPLLKLELKTHSGKMRGEKHSDQEQNN